MTESDQEDESLPDITPEMEAVIDEASKAGGRTLVDKFNISITGEE